MSWNGTTKRMVAPVGWGDISQATGVGGPPYDLGDMLKNSVIINKWAKWKPVLDSAVNLPTRYSRKASGRTGSSTDIVNRQYGVQASGFGRNVPIDAIHSCEFSYEPPQVGYWRAGDFIDPEDPTHYGYNANARLDLMGKIWIAQSQERPIIGSGGLLANDLEIDYTPHSAADAAEMMSIQDFLWEESGTTQPLDPDDMYPCILITQGDLKLVHCLYPQIGQQTLTKLGQQTGSNIWYCPEIPMSGFTMGRPATISLFLCSGRYLEGPNTGTDISNWVTDLDGDMWVVWLCPVPDACGQLVDVGTAPSSDTQVLIESIQYNSNHTKLRVYYSVLNPTMTSAFSIGASCDGSGVTFKPILIRPSSPSFSFVEFDVPGDFDGAVFAPGLANEFSAASFKNGVSTGNGMTQSLTY